VGACSEVWRGTDLVLARRVAVQILSEESAGDAGMTTWLREKARYTASLTHQGITRIYDYNDASASCPPFLVMEAVDGPSLADILAGGPLGPERALDVITQAAAALHVAHQAGLVHRGLDTAGVLLGSGDLVKLSDFTSPRAPDIDGARTVACDMHELGLLAR